MITEFVKAWVVNKDKLEDYFRNTEKEGYDTYSKIVVKLFEIVINPYLEEKESNIDYPLSERI